MSGEPTADPTTQGRQQAERKGPVIRGFALMVALLMAIWVAFSGMYDLFHLTAGLGCSILVAALTFWLMPQHDGAERDHPHFLFTFRWYLLPVFVPWLLWKITTANVQVAGLILAPGQGIDPSVIRVKTGLRGDLSRMAMAAVITLTPGTCVLDILGDEFVVHRLHPSTSEDLVSGRMVEMVRRTFEYGGGDAQAVTTESDHA